LKLKFNPHKQAKSIFVVSRNEIRGSLDKTPVSSSKSQIRRGKFPFLHKKRLKLILMIEINSKTQTKIGFIWQYFH